MLPLLSVLCLGFGADPSPAFDEQRIVRIIQSIDGPEWVPEIVAAGGRTPAAFDFYAELIADDKNSYVLTRTLLVVAQVGGDRARFLPAAMEKLAHPHVSVRRAAISLVGAIGSAADTAPLVALLSDKEWTNGVAAAKALAAIGDRRTLAAMDVWLKTSYARKDRNDKFDESFRQSIGRFRDELKARLDKTAPVPAEPTAPNP